MSCSECHINYSLLHSFVAPQKNVTGTVISLIFIYLFMRICFSSDYLSLQSKPLVSFYLRKGGGQIKYITRIISKNLIELQIVTLDFGTQEKRKNILREKVILKLCAYLNLTRHAIICAQICSYIP